MVKKVRKIGAFCFIISLVIIGGLAAYNIYMRKQENTTDTKTVKDSDLLNKDLEDGYPETPTEVVKLFCRYNISLYNHGGDMSDEQFSQMVEKLRTLYSTELVKNNSVESMVKKIQTQREEFLETKQVFLTYEVDGNNYVKNKKINGKEYAVLNATFRMKDEDTVGIISTSQFALIKENDKWKIYGFQQTSRNNKSTATPAPSSTAAPTTTTN